MMNNDGPANVRGAERPSEAPPDRWLQHRLLDRYLITEFLSAGGMGAVYRAEQIVKVGANETRRAVAVKILHDHLRRNGAELQQFIREIELLAKLGQAHLATFYEAGVLSDGTAFVVMEYVAGETLRAAMQRQPGGLPLGHALQIADHVGRALKALHEVPGGAVIHRDVKPENVMLTRDGGVKLLDLGIAKVVGQPGALTQSGLIAGTPDYMAPEQIRGESVDARCDLYALGVMTYEAITGRLPFSRERPGPNASMAAWLEVHLSERTPFPAALGVPVHIAAAIFSAMSPDPEQRPRDAAAFVLSLSGPAQTQVMTAMNSSSPQPDRSVMMFAAGVGLTLLVVGAFVVGRNSHATTPAPAAVRTDPVAQRRNDPAPAPAPVTATPVPPPAPAPAPAPAPTPVADPSAHSAAFAGALQFHFAMSGGARVIHRGQLAAADGNYLSLLRNDDTLTLVAPPGYEIMSDGNVATPEIEVVVHEHDRAAQVYEVDLSHAHRDGSDPGWVEVQSGEAHALHTVDIDHVRERSVRYVRIRNRGDTRVDIDAVYVRRLNPCTNPADCQNVTH